jgi:hypothetical protein
MKHTLLVSLFSFVVSLGLASTASAQDVAPEDVGVSSNAAARGMLDRPLFVSAGLGPSITFDGGKVQLKIQEEVGYHLLAFGDHPGLFASLSLAQSFVDFVVLQFDARVGADLLLAQIGNDMALVATPSIALGAGIFIASYSDPFGGNASSTDGAFNVQLAADVKLVLMEGLLAIWLRPIGLDIFIKDNSSVRYDILAGAQISF